MTADAEALAEDASVLRRFLSACRNLVVLTGAGCSTGSGIPDYRDRDGNWKRAAPVTHQAFMNESAVRKRYWARSLIGWPQFSAARPNGAHRALATLESSGLIAQLITQNVDGLHGAAGSTRVIELHGRIDQVQCQQCGARIARAALQCELLARNPDWAMLSASGAPDGDADLDGQDFAQFKLVECSACGGTLKPDVVFFGANVPAARVSEAMSALAQADALLVVGSSLMVYSGYRFALRAAELGVPIAAINLGRTRADALVGFKFDQPCATLLEAALDAGT